MKNRLLSLVLVFIFILSGSVMAEAQESSAVAKSAIQTKQIKTETKKSENSESKTEVKISSNKSKQQNCGCDIGNKIDNVDYPDSQKVLPIIEDVKKADKVIEGSVEKNIDVTLEDCIRFALGNNPRIREAIEEISASNARIKQAWSNYFPQLNWSSNGSRNRNLLFSDAIVGADSVYNYYILGQISLKQMIYDFGVTQNQVTIKKLGYKTAQEALTSVVNDVIKETKDKYYALLFAYDDLKVKQDNVEKFELFYNQAKAFYEIGMNPKVDVTIAEVNLSNAKLQLIQAQKNVSLAVASLNNSMGMPYVTNYNVQERLKYAPCEITLDEAMNIAKESRPDWKIAKLNIETANQNFKLTKKAYFPQITMQGSFSVGGKTPTSNWGYSWGGFLDFPTVNVMKINNEIKEAKSLYSKQMATSLKTEQDIILEIQTAYYNLIEKKNQIPVAFLGMKQAKQNYDISFGRYKVGEGNPTELKDSQISYLSAQLSYYNTLYQYNSAKATLEKAIGKNLMFGEEVVDLIQ